MNRQTWPVFTIGLVSLLILVLVPGLVTLRRTDRIQQQIRRIQEGFQQREQDIDNLNVRIHSVSILVREFLLDTSAENTEHYRLELAGHRNSIGQSLDALEKGASPEDRGPLTRLRSQLELYWQGVDPVFNWTVREKAERGTYFLRQQQRPRRQSLLDIAGELSRLNRSNFQRQYDGLDQSLREFREGAERGVIIAALIGLGIAILTILRISNLEAHAHQHQIATEQAEHQLRDLSKKLMTAQEEERRNLSRELHDEVGQLLTGLRMELGALERGRTDPDRFAEHVSQAKLMAERTMRIVRELARGLRPTVLDDLGLGAALRLQAREFARRTGKQIHVHVESDPESLPDAHRTCLYRVFQEALTNAVKHSQASEISVYLSQEDGTVRLTVVDNGIGFETTHDEGLGLRGMSERVREVGGSLQVASVPHKGTEVTASIPFPREVRA
jgi:signal transduction histidine kinase